MLNLLVSMKIKFLNKSIQNKRFEYSPMYYSERKERIERKKAQYAKLEEGNASESERREFFKDNMRHEWSRSKVRQVHNRAANIRTLILIVLIVGLGYFIFNGVDGVDTIVKKLW